jgi:glycosyltransferase involved in cell wall biosynthesis
VVQVARGAPAKTGVTTFVETIMESDAVRREFDLELLNTTRQAVRDGGTLTARHVAEAGVDAFRTYRAGRRADVVHVHAAVWPVLPLLRVLALTAAARAAGARVLCHVHSADINNGRAETFSPNRPARALLRGLAVANRLLTVSTAGEAALRRLVPRTPVAMMDNAIDVEAVPVAPLNGFPPRIVFVGILCRRKGLLDLMPALGELQRRSVTDWRLELIGDATDGAHEAAEVTEAVRASGWEDALVGSLHGSALRERLAAADIFILPSRAEGQPMAIIEAMAAGLPVIATRVGAVPDMIRDDVEGLLTTPQAPHELADALERLVVDPDLRRRLGAAARRRALERYSVSRLSAELAELYR